MKTVGAYTYTIDCHVAGVVDMMMGYPKLRQYVWKIDTERHALYIRQFNYAFLTREDFAI